MSSISLHKAITQTIFDEVKSPIITSYEIGLYVFRVMQKGEYKGKELRTKTLPSRTHLNRVIKTLLDNGIISNISGLSKNVFAYAPLFLHEKDNINKLICEIDPFSYISHLSAMVYHGLTDRLPTTVFCTSLAQDEWSEQAKLKMKQDLKEKYSFFITQTNLPSFTRIHFKKNRLLGKAINLLKTKNIKGNYVKTENGIKVASIGRVFRDMLRKPLFCGGMQHVLDVYEEYSSIYLPYILSELNQHGTKIEKARAGYILNEICNIQSKEIDLWLEDVQRGGSRKLDPNAPYETRYSEKWGISINV